MYTYLIDHSQRCIQSASLRPGTHSFSFWTHRIWHKGSNWTQKKNRMFIQITNPRKNMRTAYFTRKLKIPISQNGEMIEFRKFHSKLLFSGFCSRMISFCQAFCPAWGVKFWISTCCVTWSELFFRRDNRRHFPSAASDNKTFQSKFSLLHAFQANFKHYFAYRERNDRESNGEVC